MFELLALFFTRHQRAEHAAKYNKYRKGYQTGRCKELTPEQQLVARRKRDVGYLTLLILGAITVGAGYSALSGYTPSRSTSSARVERSVSDNNTPDPRSHTATEVASGVVLDRAPVNNTWTQSDQPCEVTTADNSRQEKCFFMQDSDGTWYIDTETAHFSYHEYSDTFLVNGENKCAYSVIDIDALGVKSVACTDSDIKVFGVAFSYKPGF